MSNIKIELLVDEFLNEIEAVKRYSKNTVESYKRDLSQFLEFLADINISTYRQITQKNNSKIFNLSKPIRTFKKLDFTKIVLS